MVKIMWWYPTEGYQMLVFAKIGKNFDMWCFLTRFFVVVGMQRGKKRERQAGSCPFGRLCSRPCLISHHSKKESVSK